MAFREEIIGDARIILGDCLEVLPIIGRVSSIIYDPPFEEEAHTPMRRTQQSIRSGEKVGLNFDAITSFQRDAIAVRAAQQCDGWALFFCQVEAVAAWRDSIEDAKAKYKRAMAWIKPDSSPQFNGQGPAQGYECIVSAWCGEGHSVWNGGGKRGVFTHLTNAKDRQGEHPTEKPLSLMKELITLFTSPGDVVCDPFMGSGTTGVASIETGRSFIGIELNEDYFNLSCRRVAEAVKQPRLFREPTMKQAKLEF